MLLIVFGHADIPDAVVAEVEHDAVGASGDAHAETAVAEQCARKKINGGFGVHDGVLLGLLVGIKRHCLLLVVVLTDGRANPDESPRVSAQCLWS